MAPVRVATKDGTKIKLEIRLVWSAGDFCVPASDLDLLEQNLLNTKVFFVTPFR